MTDLAPPAAIRSPLVHGLFDYWQSKRGPRFAPRWLDINPGEIPRLLPHLCVSEVLTAPFDLRFRIVGTSVADAAGRDFTGLTFTSMRITTGRALWQQHYLRVVEQKRPAYGRYRAEIGPDIVHYADHGAFPISNDGISVQRIIEIEDWNEVRGASPGKMDLPIWQFELL